MSGPEFVRVRDCACPDTPHPDGDGVYLRPTIGLAGGLEAEQLLLRSMDLFPLAAGAPKAEVERVGTERATWLRPRWFELFLRVGAAGWNVVDETGPVAFDVDALVADYALAKPVAERANELYGEAVMAPFQAAPPKHSGNGQTGNGTHRPSTRTPRRSRSSSPLASADGAHLTA